MRAFQFECNSLQVLAETENLAQNPNASLGAGIPVVIRTSRLSLVGVIEEIQSHHVSFIVRGALAEGSAVSIEFGAVSLAGEIVSCRSIGSKYVVCAVIPNTNGCDRRAAGRFPVTQEVRIWRAELNSPLDAVVVDLSAHGMGLALSVWLEKGETVMVESISCTAFGVVHYCRSVCDGRFHAGVEVFHVMPKQGE